MKVGNTHIIRIAQPPKRKTITMSLVSLQDRFAAIGFRFVTECVREARNELINELIEPKAPENVKKFMDQSAVDWSKANRMELAIELRRLVRSARAHDLPLIAALFEAAARDFRKKTVCLVDHQKAAVQ